jgi:hypothetical protein
MADDYTELFLKWAPGANQAAVQTWLKQHQLSSAKMIDGLLLSGSKAAIESALSFSLDNLQLPAELPVPAELKPHVASITLPKPRTYYP